MTAVVLRPCCFAFINKNTSLELAKEKTPHDNKKDLNGEGRLFQLKNFTGLFAGDGFGDSF